MNSFLLTFVQERLMMTALAMGAATATDPAAKFSKVSESTNYPIIRSPLR